MVKTHDKTVKYLTHEVSVHDGLQDGGEGGDADAGGDEDGMLSAKNVARRSTERTIDVDLRQQEVNGLL